MLASKCGWTAACAIALAATVGAQPESGPIGFVLNASGRWTVSGAPIKIGQQLAAAATLSIAAEPAGVTRRRSIVVVLADSTRLEHGCPPSNACQFALPPSLNAQATLRSRLADAFDLIFKRSDRYVSLLSRGAPNPAGNLVDAVAAIERERLTDLTPLMRDVAPGSYSLEFTPLGSGPTTTVVVPRQLASTRVRLPVTIDAGLYRVSMAGVGGRSVEQPGPDAWLLLVPPARYEDARAQFAQAQAIASAWGDAATDRERSIFLRATLDRLGGAK